MRLAAGVVLTVIAALIRPRIGEPLLVVAITVALPTLWLDALSTLIAIVPIVLTAPKPEAAPIAAQPVVAAAS